MATLKELTRREPKIVGGHRACTGCLPMVVVRQALIAAEGNAVAGFATGCMEVVSTIYPYTAYNIPYIHNAFENAAATVSGVEAAYQSLKRKGKIKKDIKFIAFGGDGGTYDIGLQSLSGAMERGHDMLYICYNNEAYMNTGIQRSSATTLGAFTSTSPAGKISYGKKRMAKNLTEIMIGHDLPYVAQANIAMWKDYIRKVEKALNTEGPTFINVLAPCTLGWRFPAEKGVEIAKMASDSLVWPVYEAEYGVRKLNYNPRNPIPVMDYIKTQGRFRHLLNPAYKEVVEELQREVKRRWENLVAMCGAK